MIPGALHRSPSIYLTAEENPQLGDRDEGAVRLVIASKGALALQMRSIVSHSSSGRKERTG